MKQDFGNCGTSIAKCCLPTGPGVDILHYIKLVLKQ